MLYRLAVPHHLQDRQMPGQICRGIGKRLLQRVAHPRLGREMHDHLDPIAEPGQGLMVGKIETVKNKLLAQSRQPRLLQPHIVIGVEVVHPHNLDAPPQQRRRHMVANKASGTGHHHAHQAMSLSSRSVSTAWPRAMWHSWMRAVSASGTSSTKSQSGKAGPPSPPRNPTVTIPISRAACSPCSTLEDRPEVVIPTSTSPGLPNPRSGRANIWSIPKSFTAALIATASSVSARDGQMY